MREPGAAAALAANMTVRLARFPGFLIVVISVTWILFATVAGHYVAERIAAPRNMAEPRAGEMETGRPVQPRGRVVSGREIALRFLMTFGPPVAFAWQWNRVRRGTRARRA